MINGLTTDEAQSIKNFIEQLEKLNEKPVKEIVIYFGTYSIPENPHEQANYNCPANIKQN